MSVKTSTFGGVLTAHYTDIYTNAVHTLAGTQMNQWGTIEDDTNFGKLLHKEGLWSLYQFREDKSLLYHMCRNEYGRMELVNNACEPNTSKCSGCYSTAPDEIRGIWTLHNFDWVQENGGQHV